MKTTCRVCGGDAIVDHPELCAFQCTCLACGWTFSHRGLTAANIIRVTEQYAFYPGGAHLSKRIGIGNGSIACGDASLDAQEWPRSKTPLLEFIAAFFGADAARRFA